MSKKSNPTAIGAFVIGAIVLWRLMSSWLRWLLIAIVVGAMFVFAKRWLSGGESTDDTE